MQNEIEISKYGQTFILSASRCLFWKEQEILIISDAHFSKETHFRKNGIAIPAGIIQHDLIQISGLIEKFNPKKIIFLGDMFHSEINEGLNAFIQWRKLHPQLNLQLIVGNHDILPDAWYTFAAIECVPEYLVIDNLIFSHDKLPLIPEQNINFYGHLHPAIRLQGNAKQSLRLPCFLFGLNEVILPAFGRFTGAKTIRPDKSTIVYAIGDREIFAVQ